MKQKERQHSESHSGARVLDIPIEHVLFDPNQPRKEFDVEALAELAESIRSQGLQQFPVVNFAFLRDGKPHYYIKAGERRYRAHQLLKWQTVTCLVEKETYDGTYDIGRKLAQAAENSSREPHTHAEIVAVMEEVVHDEFTRREGKMHGAIEIAMGRVAQAFGRSRAWAMNYYTLTHLHPELRSMLDSKNDEERLNFNAALALSRIPGEQQHELLTQAKSRKEKGGHALMYQFITQQARALRENRGIAPRGRRPSDDKVVMNRTIEGLYRLSVNFCGERRSSEHLAHMKLMLGQMGTIEVDDALHKLNEAIITFQGLQAVAQERRDTLYHGLRVVTGH